MFAQATSGVPTGEGAAESAAATPAATFHHTTWHWLLLFVYFFVSLGLVITVLLQTTKSEGLSGIIGGSTQSVFHGKKGFEERLQEITNYLAVGFITMSFLVSLFAFKAPK